MQLNNTGHEYRGRDINNEVDQHGHRLDGQEEILYGDARKGIRGIVQIIPELCQQVKELSDRIEEVATDLAKKYNFVLGGLCMFNFLLGIFLVYLQLKQ